MVSFVMLGYQLKKAGGHFQKIKSDVIEAKGLKESYSQQNNRKRVICKILCRPGVTFLEGQVLAFQVHGNLKGGQ